MVVATSVMVVVVVVVVMVVVVAVAVAVAVAAAVVAALSASLQSRCSISMANTRLLLFYDVLLLFEMIASSKVIVSA
jgi:hypothetical protein